MNRKEYYITHKGGIIRHARAAHRCGARVNGLLCNAYIGVGEDYLDSGCHDPRSSNPHKTLPICLRCAEKETPK
jgi:hypothetical protein